MFRIGSFFLSMLASISVGTPNDDISELKQLSETARHEGLQSLVGLTCHGIAEAITSNGQTVWRHHVRGSFRSLEQWSVLCGDDPDALEWGSIQNGRLVYDIDSPNTDGARMPDYGFGIESRESKLYSAESFFPSIISGGYLADLPFVEVFKKASFDGAMSKVEDSLVFGRCWAWSVGSEEGLPPYTVKVWFRSFENGAIAIGKLEFSLPNGKMNRVTNEFSSDPTYPSLITKVVTEEYGAKRLFEISRIEPENEPPNGFAPERFGLKSPTDPLKMRVWLFAAAIATGTVAIYLTLRLRQRSK